MTEKIQVLFVCLGNICRSPTAHGVFRQAVEQAGLAGRIEIDSCGTGDWHVGKSPDQRAVVAALRRGVDISDLRARQIQPTDLQAYEYVLVMDRQNLNDVNRLWQQHGGTRPQLFLTYDDSDDTDEVPDPYYGGEQGFDRVFDLITHASEGLLADLRSMTR